MVVLWAQVSMFVLGSAFWIRDFALLQPRASSEVEAIQPGQPGQRGEIGQPRAAAEVELPQADQPGQR
jgi:hypothetical protein